MTENEAIEELQNSIELAKMCTQNYERKREIQGYKTAIKALEEVQQYRAIGTVEECREAVEKQTAKKPEFVDTRFMNNGKHISNGCQLQKLKADLEKAISKNEDMDCLDFLRIASVIDKQPTAYDPDKVVEQLEERTSFLKYCTKYGNQTTDQQSKSYDTMMMYEVKDLVDDLLEIVKAGGTDGN